MSGGHLLTPTAARKPQAVRRGPVHADNRPVEDAANEAYPSGLTAALSPDSSPGQPRGNRTTASIDSSPSRDPNVLGASLLAPGTTIGRYVIERPIGQGGMGVVYEAFDPQLDRRVAIKFVSIRGKHDRRDVRDRMLRESHALAQLAHPNIVPIFDSGVVRGDIFLAMELVEGVDLRTWCQEGARPLKEVLAHFIAAGEGLAEAHRAGIVHRDFKPHNVLLGNDGRVRVIDFGLARALWSRDIISRESTSSSGESDARSSVPPSRGCTRIDASVRSHANQETLAAQLTEAGTVLGTPRYMSPEQHTGRPTDARSDQFSFCVALYEAVAGVPPFDGSSPKAILRSIRAQRLTQPKHDMPRWLKRALARGLSVRPDHRYPSMNDLLAVLKRDRRRVRQTAALTVAGTLVLSSMGLVFMRPDPGARCAAALNDVRPVMTRTREEALRRALDVTTPAGQGSLKGIVHSLQRFEEAYQRGHQAACEATHVRGTQSMQMLDLRMACLDRRRAQMATVLERLGDTGHREGPSAMAEAVERLAHISHCNDAARLLEEEGADAAGDTARAEVAEMKALQHTLDRAEVASMAGDTHGAREVFERSLSTARARGWVKLEARSHYLLASNLMTRGEYKAAAEGFAETALIAADAESRYLVAKSYINLINLRADGLADYEGALALDLPARVAIAAAGDALSLEGEFAQVMGAAHLRKSDFQKSAEYMEKAVAAFEKLDSPVLLASSLSNSAAALIAIGKVELAKVRLTRAVGLIEENLGPVHPSLAPALNNLALAYAETHEVEQSIDLDRRSLAVLQAAYGDEHPKTATATLNLGISERDTGHLAEAEALLTRARDTLERTVGPSHPFTAVAELNLARVFQEREEDEAAIALISRAQTRLNEGDAADSQWHAMASQLLAFSYATLGKHQEALFHAKHSEAIVERVFGSTDPQRAALIHAQARSLLALKKHSEARKTADRALTMYLASEGVPSILVHRTRLTVARSHLAWGGDRARARALLQEVVAALTGDEDPEAIEVRAEALSFLEALHQ